MSETNRPNAWSAPEQSPSGATPDRPSVPADDSGHATVQSVTRSWGEGTAGSAPPLPPPSPSAPSPLPPAPPTQAFAGLRYEPLRHHASGGLGDVFVARDQELDREVALKRLHPALADEPDAQARFEREAEITGRLEHPGVVPLYGKGRDANDRPFYAMRFIRGQSLRDAITDFYRIQQDKKDTGDRGLAFRSLLQHFTATCNTIAYAHSRGVIHRDLKPANVMLGPYGETLVVDWGLAKPVGDDAAGGAAPPKPTDPDATPAGATLGTPAYMGPEQAVGGDVGPAGDVFSLGAMLYEIVTGRPPYRGALALVDAAAGMFPRPRQVRRDAPRALEAVCLKAMAFRPEERYARALDLAREVDRWLADEPTTAYREPWRVRAWRWVKRRRTPVAAAAAALLAAAVLVGGGLGWKADQDARSAAAAARRAEERARDVSAGLAETARLRDQERLGEAGKALEGVGKLAADGGPAEWAERVAQARKDLQMVADLEEAPLLETRIREGQYDRAAVPEGFRKAFQAYGIDMDALEPAAAAAHIRASDVHEQLIVALDYWASRLPEDQQDKIERLLDAAGRADDDDSRKELRQAWSRHDRPALERLLDGRDDASLPPTTAVALALRLFQLGADARSEQLLRTAQRVHPDNFWINYSLLGLLVETPARRDEGVGFMRAAMAERPDNPMVHNDLAILLAGCGRPEEAEKEYRRALALKDDFPTAHVNLGVLLAAGGRPEEAEKEYRRALQLNADLAQAHNDLGNLLVKRGQPEEAEKEYRRVLQLKEDDPTAHYNLAILLVKRGQPEEAEKEYRRALQLKEDDAKVHSNLANLLESHNRHEEAEKEDRRALQLQEDSPLVHYNLGNLLVARGRPGEAEQEYRRSGQLKPDFALAHFGLAMVLQSQGKFDEAISSMQRALELLPPTGPFPAQGRALIASCKHLQELDARLPAVVRGEVQPTPAERVEFAQLCQYKRRHAAAARLYSEAFAQQASLADDLAAGHRYQAACAAALAGVGRGDDASDLDRGERARLRGQSLDWLRADLSGWDRLRRDSPKLRPQIQQTLQHWKNDADLEGVRAGDALDRFAEEERTAWGKLWADVDGVLKESVDDK